MWLVFRRVLFWFTLAADTWTLLRVGLTLLTVTEVLALAVPVSSSVSVRLIVFRSLAVPVGLSSRYWCTTLKLPPLTLTVCAGEIGRASCREGVLTWVVEVSLMTVGWREPLW